WKVKEWKGTLFPAKAKPNTWLHYTASTFDFIEFGATFYGTPKPQVLEGWLNSLKGTNCLLFPKMNISVSHYKRLRDSAIKTDEFLVCCEQLGNHLGGVLLQLPDHYSVLKNKETFKAYLNHWPQDVKLFVEIREDAFFESINEQQELLKFMRDLGIGLVVTDTNLKRDVLHQYLTTKDLYIRFQSNNFHPTDSVRLNDWMLNIKELGDMGLANAYFAMHTPAMSAMPHFVDYFKQLK
nr:DUF72 domain-containing protein [Pseudopedobacter sp.]